MEDSFKNKKYTAILDAAKELFWKHGIRRVSIEEICQKAETSKMTFYRYFPNKLELAKTVIDRFYDEGMTNFRKLIRENSPVSVKMQKIMQMKLEGTTDISNDFIQDLLHSTNIELSAFFEKKLKYVYSEGLMEFKTGQKEGWIRKDLNVDFMFYYFQRTSNILADESTLKYFSSPQEMIMEVTNLMIYGIAPRE
jgi:AcrR family transcriptional regulator